MKVAPSEIKSHLKRGNVSLSRAIEIADQFHAPEIEIAVGVGHSRKGLVDGAVRDMVNYVRRLLDGSPEAVIRAGVVGKDMSNDDAPSEFLDLIAPKKLWEFDDLELGADLRYTLQSRFRALERARFDWLRQ